MEVRIAGVCGNWSAVVDECKLAKLVLLQSYPPGKTATVDSLHREAEPCRVHSKGVWCRGIDQVLHKAVSAHDGFHIAFNGPTVQAKCVFTRLIGVPCRRYPFTVPKEVYLLFTSVDGRACVW